MAPYSLLYNMKKIFISLFFTAALSQITFAQNNIEEINLSSVDYFFKISEKLSTGLEPKEYPKKL